VPAPASRANRAVEVEKVANVLTRLIETVSAPAGPDPLEAAKQGICELRRDIATILDESRRSLPAIFASMWSENQHEKNYAFWGACAVFQALSDSEIKEAWMRCPTPFARQTPRRSRKLMGQSTW
jgi:hypothetical protein